MRHDKVGLQLGADQKYYISRCKEKSSIQLTIVVSGSDEKHTEERNNLIDYIYQSLTNIMNLFMPAAKDGLSLFVPCAWCSELHIELHDLDSNDTIFCPNNDDKCLPPSYYGDLRNTKSVDATAIAGKIMTTLKLIAVLLV